MSGVIGRVSARTCQQRMRACSVGVGGGGRRGRPSWPMRDRVASLASIRGLSCPDGKSSKSYLGIYGILPSARVLSPAPADHPAREHGGCGCHRPLPRQSPDGHRRIVRHAAAAGRSPPTIGGSTTPCGTAPTANGCSTRRWSACRASNGSRAGAFAAAPSPTCTRRGHFCSRPPSGPRRFSPRGRPWRCSCSATASRWPPSRRGWGGPGVSRDRCRP